MSEFKIIETQEQFEERLKDRLKRERESVRKEYEGFLSPSDVEERYKGFLSPDDVKEKYKNHLSPDEVEKLNSKIKGYETASVKTRIAHETGLSYEAIEFLKGDDEDSIRKSAESLKGLVGINNVAPLASTESNVGDATDAALRNTLKGLKGE